MSHTLGPLLIGLAGTKVSGEERTWLSHPDVGGVVLFTRKVASSGQFKDVALNFCENLVYDQEDLVLKGVGWSLKDMMRGDKARILDYVMDLRARGVSNVVTLYAIKDLKGDERARVLGKS